MAGKVVENGGISGYYALAVVGGTLLLMAGFLSAEKEQQARKRTKPRKARNRLGKVQKAVATKRSARSARPNRPDESSTAVLRAKHDEIEARLRKLREEKR